MATEEYVTQLERLSEIADARLGVAEEFAWAVGGLAGMLAYSVERSWVWAILAFIAGFVVSVYPLRKAADKARGLLFPCSEHRKICRHIARACK